MATSESTRYWPYGAARTGEVETAYRYTGQRLDAGSTLYYYGARWYDGSLGRFIQPDTIVPEPGNPQDLNRFSYARNNPTKYTDPTGHYVDWGVGGFPILDPEKQTPADQRLAEQYALAYWRLYLLQHPSAVDVLE